MLRRTDEGIFLCVPSPTKNEIEPAEKTSTGSTTDLEGPTNLEGPTDLEGPNEESSEGGNSPWVRVVDRGHKKTIKWDRSTRLRSKRVQR